MPSKFISVQFSLSRVRLFATPWTAACQAFLSINNSWSLPKLKSIKSMMPANHLILCRPLFLPPSIFPSIRVFSKESELCIRWPKCWSFSFNINPSSEHSGLICFRMDWLDLLAVQGTLKSLLCCCKWQHCVLVYGFEWYFAVCIFVSSLSINLLRDTCCFFILAIANNAAMNLGVYIYIFFNLCVCVCVFQQWNYWVRW